MSSPRVTASPISLSKAAYDVIRAPVITEKSTTVSSTTR